ncbi:Uncharacterised protein [Legionella hackeliae]|uniref:Uncharacterized protein n=1 Tax=Legionella hackeliae TaxID=449 RepID=A0A0A8UU44_LEGHA|nr:protein of unknown function [Legionella hackeliae]STX47019.1 Uncharacterised protein [Legionella hackeliae]
MAGLPAIIFMKNHKNYSYSLIIPLIFYGDLLAFKGYQELKQLKTTVRERGKINWLNWLKKA